MAHVMVSGSGDMGTLRRPGGLGPAVGWQEPKVIWHRLENSEREV